MALRHSVGRLSVAVCHVPCLASGRTKMTTTRLRTRSCEDGTRGMCACFTLEYPVNSMQERKFCVYVSTESVFGRQASQKQSLLSFQLSAFTLPWPPVPRKEQSPEVSGSPSSHAGERSNGCPGLPMVKTFPHRAGTACRCIQFSHGPSQWLPIRAYCLQANDAATGQHTNLPD